MLRENNNALNQNNDDDGQDNPLKVLIEEGVDVERFSLNSLYNDFIDLIHSNPPQFQEIIGPINELEANVNDRLSKQILHGIFRFSFLIEPVKQPKIDSTKYAFRWGDELDFYDDDPRKSSFQSCYLLFIESLNLLVERLDDQQIQNLTFLYDQTLVPYEIPIDYIDKDLDSIHVYENIQWILDDDYLRTISLRQELRDSTFALSDFFKVVYKKIQVKAHLTDRVLTGSYKTNREKRWEVHPASVHFAYKKDSLAIEHHLITQLCYFDGFPVEVQESLENEGLISFSSIDDKILKGFPDKLMRCPITLFPMSFHEIHEEILDPTHGRSRFQVGHIYPLKAEAVDGESGQTANNISWISDLGNRIQGDLSVDETRDHLYKILTNYRRANSKLYDFFYRFFSKLSSFYSII